MFALRGSNVWAELAVTSNTYSCLIHMEDIISIISQIFIKSQIFHTSSKPLKTSLAALFLV